MTNDKQGHNNNIYNNNNNNNKHNNNNNVNSKINIFKSIRLTFIDRN